MTLQSRIGASGATALIAAAAFALAIFAGGPAQAEAGETVLAQSEADPFSALVGSRRARAERARARDGVERYIVSGDDRSFLIEHKGGEGRIRFLCGEDDPRLDCRIDPDGPSEEIFLVTGVLGPRGDLIFKDQEGDTLLRIASYGGATVFWPGERDGMAASRTFYEGEQGLDLPPAGRGAAHRRAQAAAAHLSALTGTAILFDIGQLRDLPNAAFAETAFSADAAPAAEEETEGRIRRNATVLADAVARTAGGMHNVANDPTGARILGLRISQVRFVIGAPPSLSLDDKTLTVVYDPAAGLKGRPSSSAVEHFLENNL